ncbi:MAG: hypothetical protein Q4P20_03510 [Eubacteriales bacterium]|nr:hypothetical protein [Eubacteriales bacterium]
MSFFRQLRDEVNDRNIDKEKMKKLTKELDESELEAEEAAAANPEIEEDPEYPAHPPYISLKPQLTEVQLWRLPAVRFYCTILFFCFGMILYGIINQVFGLGMDKGAVGWYQLIGAAIGFLLSREVIEPRLKIPFSQGTPEQKKKAAEAYIKQMDALDEHINELRKRRGVEPEQTDNKNK